MGFGGRSHTRLRFLIVKRSADNLPTSRSGRLYSRLVALLNYFILSRATLTTGDDCTVCTK